MQSLVLNLRKDAERWRQMEYQSIRLGLEMNRLDAVAGSELSPREISRLYCPELNRRQFHRPLVKGEIGCYASHREAWRRLLAGSDACLAVFEDDVELSPDLPWVLDLISRLPPGWDMVKLIGRCRETVLRSCPLGTGSEMVAYRRLPSLTGAYVVSRSGANKLLQHRTPFGRPVDVDLRHWWECNLRVFGLLPYPVRLAPASASSTIADRHKTGRTAGTRWRKLRLQLSYTASNWWALHGPRFQPWPASATSRGRDAGSAPELQRFFSL